MTDEYHSGFVAGFEKAKLMADSWRALHDAEVHLHNRTWWKYLGLAFAAIGVAAAADQALLECCPNRAIADSETTDD